MYTQCCIHSVTQSLHLTDLADVARTVAVDKLKILNVVALDKYAWTFQRRSSGIVVFVLCLKD